ncbi:PE family protein [Mycobacterium sp. 852002-50816_SCH5313054-b]|uniref:PE family protein n=1 Tax=Mycobacterium sp. 852002-50816_SCH5313054-b TaxID=1834092 RepID=UPI0007FCB438|nr:PE family protein [Mycobacterium sp. 852002-50816_SCH5313054-b]OBF45646.1 PE family protein [Mycobacterium sp. 852002-50816_SCH5313054-b]
MSNVITRPELLAAAAAEMHSLNALVAAGNEAAAVPTTGVVPAAADVVSMLTAAHFASHARLYQEVSAQAAALRDLLATTLGVSAGSYDATEAANTTAVS